MSSSTSICIQPWFLQANRISCKLHSWRLSFLSDFSLCPLCCLDDRLTSNNTSERLSFHQVQDKYLFWCTSWVKYSFFERKKVLVKYLFDFSTHFRNKKVLVKYLFWFKFSFWRQEKYWSCTCFNFTSWELVNFWNYWSSIHFRNKKSTVPALVLILHLENWLISGITGQVFIFATRKVLVKYLFWVYIIS